MILNGQPLSPGDIEEVARRGARIELGPRGEAAIQRGHRALHAALADGAPHYGINTGFGALGRVRIPADELAALQINLIRSHSTGVGPPLPRDVVRAMGLTLAGSLCRGHSGVRVELVRQIVGMLNAGITPVIPETGSVGASGDLAPLAHFAQALLGEGEVEWKGKILPAMEGLVRARLSPLALEAKEGLALINGTHLMCGRGALLVVDFERLFAAAVLATAMSIDACRATISALDPRIHILRRQPGPIEVARQLREMLAGSEIVESHRENDPRVQDPYSFRCCPAVLGAAWDAFVYVRGQILAELGAVTDNPLVFPAEDSSLEAPDPPVILSGGNFHGMPLAIPLDVMALAICHLAGIAERRVFHMLSGNDPEAELPSFLTPQAGLCSGLMITQYTAAACCNELIGLTLPASPGNLSTSAGMEDYNSFGPRGVAKAARGIELARSVVAVELLCAATGIDFHRPLRSGPAVERAHAQIRAEIPPLEEDRSPAPDLRIIEQMISLGELTGTK